jgi:hypothetical protein
MAESWLPNVRAHQQRFAKPTNAEEDVEDVQMDEERQLDLDPGQEACSSSCRLDFGEYASIAKNIRPCQTDTHPRSDPARMMDDEDDQIDPIKAQLRAAKNEKRRQSIESRKSKNRSRATTANSTVSGTSSHADSYDEQHDAVSR